MNHKSLKYHLIVLILFWITNSSIVYSQTNIYEIEKDKIAKPIKIHQQITDLNDGDYMRDPLPPGVKIDKIIIKRKAVKRKAVKLKINPARLSFKKITVKGHYTRPAVQFDRDLLPMGKVNVPIKREFLHKVHKVDFAK